MMNRFLLVFALLLMLYPAAGQTFNEARLLENMKTLSSDEFGGRKTGTEGNAKARDLILRQMKEAGVKPYTENYLQAFSFTQSFGFAEKVQGLNILGVIPGKTKNKGTIVISAHYDHVGTNNNEVYNGADDNASGTAALLELMAYFKNNAPEHRIIIAFFDAEEKGLKGSAHFVNSLDLEKEKIILNVNMDMISRSETSTLYACGGYHYPHVKKILETVQTPAGITLGFGYDDPILKRNDWTSQSDQYNFHLKKIPFVYFGVEDHADYHRPTDDFEKVNPEFYKKSVETILRGIIALDKHLD